MTKFFFNISNLLTFLVSQFWVLDLMAPTLENFRNGLTGSEANDGC